MTLEDTVFHQFFILSFQARDQSLPQILPTIHTLFLTYKTNFTNSLSTAFNGFILLSSFSVSVFIILPFILMRCQTVLVSVTF